MLQPTNLFFDQVGALSSGSTIDFDETKVVSYTVTAGKKAVLLQIVNGSECWFGGFTVSPTDYIGNIMTPRMLLIFRNVKSTFKVYFRGATGKSGKVGINEFD